MRHSLIATLVVLGLAMSGCFEPTAPSSGNPVPETPTPYAPTAIVGEPATGNGGSDPSEPRWGVYVDDWSLSLPRQDARLNLSIIVYGDWFYEDNVPPFEGDNWTFRLHVERGIHNATEVSSPPGADWFRSYDLTGVPNATASHHTSFFLGDLDGESFRIRLTYHKVFESGFWEAWEATVRYWVGDGTYRLDGGPSGRIVCSPMAGRMCPWSGEYGNTSSPPPADW